MNITIEPDAIGYTAHLLMDFADLCIWRVVHRVQPPTGWGDCPTEALQDLLQQLLEHGDRRRELIAMLDAENDAALVRSEP